MAGLKDHSGVKDLSKVIFTNCFSQPHLAVLFLAATAKIIHKYRDYFFPVSVVSVFPKRFNRWRNREQCTSHDPRMQFLFHAISEETLIGCWESSRKAFIDVLCSTPCFKIF